MVLSQTDGSIVGLETLLKPEIDRIAPNAVYDIPLLIKSSTILSEIFSAALNSEKPPATSGSEDSETAIKFIEEPPRELTQSGELDLNGTTYHVLGYDSSTRTVRLNGKKINLRPGINTLGTVGQAITYWWEKQRLQLFNNPYPENYAVIVAIDDYDRRNDKKRRGPTGFRSLGTMLSNAEALKDTLIKQGFESDHIFTLFDEEATSENIEMLLTEFWTGGKYADASRLVVYLGGHGGVDDGNGFFVTYDYDPSRPSTHSILMSDFVGRQFSQIKAHHVFVAIDACNAGLAIPGAKTQGGSTDAEKFAVLANIRAAVSDPARDLLVAGTSDQSAVEEEKTGGLFTEALLDGLKGAADKSKTGVINFTELGDYVRSMVIARAAEYGVKQEPVPFPATRFGNGQVLFFSHPLDD
jgi:Caspase domain